MTSDQWFSFWMTILQVVGGGVLALGGVWLGMWHADKRRREDADEERADRLRELQRAADARQRAVLQDWLDLMVDALADLRVPVQPPATHDEKAVRIRDLCLSRWYLRQPAQGTEEYDLAWPFVQKITEWAKAEDNLDGHRDSEFNNACLPFTRELRARVNALEAQITAP